MYCFDNMNDHELISAYQNGVELRLSPDLLKLLYVEMAKRGIEIPLSLSSVQPDSLPSKA